MRVLDLFSGVGGFSLGLERAGMKTVAFCEIEPYARRVLAKHWPETPLYEDVRTLTAARLAADKIAYIDLVCGGFPCQPWSLAGRRKGGDDSRHLWPEMLRIIRDCKPAWVIGENVPGLDDKRFMALDGVLIDLESAGYEGRPFEIPACAVDAPHKRARLFIVAHRNRARSFPSALGGIHSREEGARAWNGQFERCGGARTMANSERAGLEKLRRVSGDGGGKLVRAGGDPQSHFGEHEWLVDPTGKARRVKPGIRLLAHGVPGRTHQIRALGNSVVPQIVEEIGRAILACEAAA